MKKNLCILILISNFGLGQNRIAIYHGDEFKKQKTVLYGVYDYTLKNNLKDGHWLFFKTTENDSILRLEVTVIDGKKHGFEREYYNSGQLKFEKYFNQGIPDSVWSEYHPNGNLILLERYSNGMLNGESKYYFGGVGAICETTFYINGVKDGQSSKRLITGEILSETEWKNGKRNGFYREYYLNGQIRIEGYYYPFKEYEYYSTDQNQTGTWKYWNENGELVKTEVYEKGRLVSLVENISSNNFAQPDTVVLIAENCFGKYCLGVDIRSIGTTNYTSYTRQGNDTLYYIYHGDSIDQISLTPNSEEPEVVNSMRTFSVRFRTNKGIGIGSTIQELIESGEQFTILRNPNNDKPYIYFTEYKMKAHLDQNTIALFLHSEKSYQIENFRPEGFIIYLEMER